MTARDLQTRLRSLGNPADAAFLSRFFKTGPGQYGEGDVLIGVRVPAIRTVALEFKGLPLGQVERLLHSAIHEERLAALVILVMQAAEADAAARGTIYDSLPGQHEVRQQLGPGGRVGPVRGRGVPGRQGPPAAVPACPVVVAVGAAHRRPCNIPLHPSGRVRRLR